MKTRPEMVMHGIIALIWVSLALGISVKIALLGNEEANLGKQRGSDFRTRSDLAFDADRLRAEVDQATSPSTLELALRQIGLLPGATSELALAHPATTHQ